MLAASHVLSRAGQYHHGRESSTVLGYVSGRGLGCV
jgi:hypothetical protein